MASSLILGLSALLLVCAAVDAQKNYDGRNGPHVFGPPGEQVYIRGQNEGPYNVPGTPGTFQNSPARGEHVYTDERGTTYVHRKGGNGGAGTHSISGPNLVAHRGPAQPGAYGAQGPQSGPGSRPRRGVVISRPDRVVATGGGTTYIGRNRRDIHVGRPDRTVDYSSGGDFVIQRHSRSPQPQSGYISRPDGRSVSYGPGGFIANGQDGRTVAHSLSRKRRARVQGENFVARDNQAGVWNDQVSVWKRPDGRTVTIDQNGNVITSGSPNGRGPQRYSG